ncbi:hypothetical protein HY440_03245 [Candidatus Microgenomates bacterium]|nr:hypothetical protein [Candidatus Microgenomates bacterium]
MDAKKKKQFVPADNPVEQLKNLSTGVVQDLSEVPAGILDEALKQIGLKEQKQPLNGEINLTTGIQKDNAKAEQKDAADKMRQLHAVQSKEKEVFSIKQKQLEQQIGKVMQELQIEVKKLQAQTSELSGAVKSVTVETMPAKPGAYHLNYFEWVISMLRDLRKRVSESRHWLALWNQKKKQKGYWAMFKKHGTTFAMSEERAIASANG